jgi:hypothetical protein
MELFFSKIEAYATISYLVAYYDSFIFHRPHLNVPEIQRMELIRKSHLYRLKLRWLFQIFFKIFSMKATIYVLTISSQIECKSRDWSHSETAEWSWIWSENSSINDTENDINSERNGRYFWSPMVFVSYLEFSLYKLSSFRRKLFLRGVG